MKAYLLMILLFMSISISAETKYDQITSFDCNKATTYVDKKICSNKALATKDRILSDLYNIAKKDRDYLIDIQRNWVKNRNACENEKCINLFYILRIKELTKLISFYETNLVCGATLRCNLVKRLWLGSYQDNKLFYDKVKMQQCFKGCGEAWIEHWVYEVKNGEKIKETAWAGQLNKISGIEPEPISARYEPGSLKIKDGDSILFYSDTGSNDRGNVKADSLQKTKNGWIKNSLDSK